MNKRYQTGYIKQKPYSLNTPSFNLADLRLEDIPETPSILNSNDWLNNIGSIAGGISGVIGTFLQNSRIGDTSDVEDQINSAANYKVGAYSNESLLDEWGNYNPLDYVTYSDIRGGNVAQRGLNTLSSIGSGAMGGASIGGPIGAIVGGVAGLGSSIAGWLTGNAKARRKVKELNNKIDAANRHVQSSFVNSARSIDEINDMSILSNYSAYGGPINIFGSGAIDYELAKEDLYNKQLSAMSKYKMSSMPNSFGMPELAMLAKGGKIHIKKANRGKFTDYCGGKVTSECIARGKRSKSAAVRKPLDSLVADINRRSRADFIQRLLDPDRDYINDWESDNIATHKLGYATDDKGAIVFPNVQRINGRLYDFTDPKNKRGKWDALESAIERGDTLRMTPAQAEEFTKTYKKYYPKGKTFKAFGGWLNSQGGDFSNGVTIIGNGGTHEENPMEGVPMGVAPDGTPNLVEQGEVKFNNYVFSNRLFATGGLLAAHNLPTTYADHSFADIAERLSKESSERPNDPISKRGLMSAMTRLQQAQEQVRMEENRGGNKYAHGGKMGRKYDGEGDEPNLLQFQFNPSAITGDTGSDTDIEDPDTNSSRPRQKRGASWLRYAPVVGAGLGVLTDALGWTNSPDYGNADLVGSAVDNLTNVEFTPIGNYLTYRPLDRNYYINKLNAQAGATRRAIVNQSGGNRATALAGLLAADYNAQSVLGDLARQAEEYNFNQRKDVETFNRGTNQFNSEMGLKASIVNRANDKLRLQARTTQAQLRDQVDARASAGRTANLTNLFDSLGEIGREEFSRNMIQTNPALYYSIDSSGRITYKNGYEDLSEAEKKIVRDAANKAKGKKKAKGGYLTIRKGK